MVFWQRLWQRLWQVTLSTVKALMWIGVASFVMSVLSDFVSSPQDPALTADFLRSVEQLDVEKFKVLVERSKVHVDADPQSEGTALYKLCSQKETETTLLMVDLLLKRPDINPNGSPSAWTPLKAAVGLQNHQTVKLLLDHPETLTQINVAGLDCSIVPRLPERVVLVLDATAPECFRSHVATLDAKDPDVIPLSAVQITMRGKKKAGAPSTAKASQPTDGNAEGPAAKGATTRQTPTSKPASSSSSSSHAKLKPLHEAPVVPGYLGSPDELEFPAPLVVDPTKWDSFSSVLAYYLGLHSLPSVRGLAIAWIAIVSSTLYFGVKVARRAQALGGAAEVPPAPPAAAAEAVLQAEAPPVQ